MSSKRGKGNSFFWENSFGSSEARKEDSRWKEEKARKMGLKHQERRKEYSCGKDFVTIHDIPTWRYQYINSKEDERPNVVEMAYMQKDLLKDFPLKDMDLSEKVSVYRGDITHLELDSVVNAANNSLLGGGGVDGAIHRAAGRYLLMENRTLNGCKDGEAKLSCGYDLPAKNVISTVGPKGEGRKVLEQAYSNCLKLMLNHNLRSTAFPCISTGIYGFPNDSACIIALKTVRRFLEQHHQDVDRIIFCLFLDVDVELYLRFLPVFFPVLPDLTRGIEEVRPETHADNRPSTADTGSSGKTHLNTQGISEGDNRANLDGESYGEARAYGKESRDYGTESRDYGKESRDYGKESRDFGKESRDFGKESRDHDAESRDYDTESRDYGKVSRGCGKESWDYGKESRDYGKETRDSGKESRDFGKDSRDYGNESLDYVKESSGSGSGTSASADQPADYRNEGSARQADPSTRGAGMKLGGTLDLSCDDVSEESKQKPDVKFSSVESRNQFTRSSFHNLDESKVYIENSEKYTKSNSNHIKSTTIQTRFTLDQTRSTADQARSTAEQTRSVISDPPTKHRSSAGPERDQLSSQPRYATRSAIQGTGNRPSDKSSGHQNHIWSHSLTAALPYQIQTDEGTASTSDTGLTCSAKFNASRSGRLSASSGGLSASSAEFSASSARFSASSFGLSASSAGLQTSLAELQTSYLPEGIYDGVGTKRNTDYNPNKYKE